MLILSLDGVIFELKNIEGGQKLKMKLNITIEDDEVERFVLILNSGLLFLLKNKIFNIEEVENFLYNPYSMNRLKKLGVNDEVVDLIHE